MGWVIAIRVTRIARAGNRGKCVGRTGKGRILMDTNLKLEMLQRENRGLKEIICKFMRYTPGDSSTFWNGKPCRARRCIVVVDKPHQSTFWYADLEGTERPAIEISKANPAVTQPFYIDDEYGLGWYKVTLGKGSPGIGHRSLNVKTVVEYL